MPQPCHKTAAARSPSPAPRRPSGPINVASESSSSRASSWSTPPASRAPSAAAPNMRPRQRPPHRCDKNRDVNQHDRAFAPIAAPSAPKLAALTHRPRREPVRDVHERRQTPRAEHQRSRSHPLDANQRDRRGVAVTEAITPTATIAASLPSRPTQTLLVRALGSDCAD